MENKTYKYGWIEIDGNHIHRTAIIYTNVKLGTGNWIGAYTVIGSNGEIRNKDQRAFKGKVVIGNNNVISELVTIQRPFEESRITEIGNNNIIMAHSHIRHDARIGNNTEICTGSIIGGYVDIEDDARIKLGVTIRPRVSIGIGATIAMQSAVISNVKDNATFAGVPAKEMKRKIVFKKEDISKTR